MSSLLSIAVYSCKCFYYTKMFRMLRLRDATSLHFLLAQHCFLTPSPPNLGLSRQSLKVKSRSLIFDIQGTYWLHLPLLTDTFLSFVVYGIAYNVLCLRMQWIVVSFSGPVSSVPPVCKTICNGIININALCLPFLTCLPFYQPCS